MKSFIDARDYVAGDRVVCLICGEPSRSLGQHVRHSHGLTARAYKERFGLPVSRGLEPADKRQARADAIRATRAAGHLPQTPPPNDRAKGHKPAYVRADMHRFGEAEIHALMACLRKGDTITEACARPGIPSWSSAHSYLKRHPATRAAFDALIESLPFSQQARMKKLGKRFGQAVHRLEHLSCREAGVQLGVSDEVVRRYRTSGRGS